jgi:hypothetical protein
MAGHAAGDADHGGREEMAAGEPNRLGRRIHGQGALHHRAAALPIKIP